MNVEKLPIQNYNFPVLAAGRPGTVADRVPLVMWRDTISDRYSEVALRHEDFFSLYFVRHGRGAHVINGVPYAIARGDVYAMGVGMTHLFTECDDLETDTIHFSPTIFDPPTLEALSETAGFLSLFVEEPLRRGEPGGQGGRWLHLTPDAYATVCDMLAELQAEWASGTPAGALLTRALFFRLLVFLARRYAETGPALARPPATASAVRETTVAAAVHFLDEYFAGSVRIEQVAASVFLSPDRFTEVFAAAMGRTPRDYLRHLRLERAKTLLTTTALSISEIGQQSGFGEASYFTRAFKSATGLTPRDYRRQTI